MADIALSTQAALDSKTSFTYEEVEQIAQSLLKRVKCRPKLGIICGSGLGKLADVVENQEIIPYTEIAGFPTSTVAGHEGKLVFGTLQGKSVVLMKGRAHCYEGYSIQKSVLPVRTMKLMGVTTLFVTNAAGGINQSFNPGDIMLIKDHINMPGFSGVNPLVGPNDERFGTRFPAMSAAYDVGLRKLAKETAGELGFSSFIREGVYCMCIGPMYETIAETKYFHLLNIDAVGMSTVSEVITAVHCGLRVLALSLVANMVIQDYEETATTTHQEVLEGVEKRSRDLQALIKSMVKKVDL